MQELKCANCGAQLHPAPGAATVRCPFCGAEYMLDSSAPSAAKPGIREVAGSDGTPIVSVYVPQGWEAKAGVLGGNHSHQTPVIPMLTLTCKGGRIAFTGARAYYNSANGMVADGQYDIRTCAEYCRYTTARQQAEKRLAEFAQHVALADIRFVQENPLAAAAQKEFEDQVQQMQAANPGAMVEGNCGEYLYTFRIGQEEGCFLCASAAIRIHSSNANLGMGMLGGLLGRFADAIQPEQWFMLFDCTLLCPRGCFAAYNKLFEQTIATIQMTPQLQQAIAGCHARYGQAQCNIANYASQAAAQTSQNLSRIGREEQQILQQQHENFSASQDRMAQLRHESTMEVNTYHGIEGHDIEFSTRADHVYQNQHDPDILLGKEGAPLEGMPDWPELDQKH